MDNFIFDKELKSFFGAKRGAGSRVTPTEAGDSQITFAQDEGELLLAFNAKVPIGGVKSLKKQGIDALYSYRLFPTGQKVQLNTVHPKPDNNELRVYLQKSVFKPPALDFWFIFERDDQLWIGSLHESELAAARSGAKIDLQNGFDHNEEDSYQEAINYDRPELVRSSTLSYRRDPRVAVQALVRSEYNCELMPEHETFTSKVTGKPYLEAHHFVPMMEQRHFSVSIDVPENICILNPYAHKMLHHATYSEIEPIIEALGERRQGFLKDIGVSMDKVLRSYGEN